MGIDRKIKKKEAGKIRNSQFTKSRKRRRKRTNDKERKPRKQERIGIMIYDFWTLIFMIMHIKQINQRHMEWISGINNK